MKRYYTNSTDHRVPLVQLTLFEIIQKCIATAVLSDFEVFCLFWLVRT